MSRSTAPFLIACALAAGAGVTIAGVPSRASVRSFEVAPSIPKSPTSTTLPAPSATTLPETTIAATTLPETTIPETAAPTNPQAGPAAPTPSVPISSAPEGLAGAGALRVLVVNGAGASRLAAAGAERLVQLGYQHGTLADAVDPQQNSTLYYVPGRELDALQMKEAIGFRFLPVQSNDEMPTSDSTAEYDLALVLGLDYELIIGE